MRIMWLSNAPWAPTGYGNQTGLFLPYLNNLGHEISVTAFYGLEGRMLEMNGTRIYPKGAHPYGMDVTAVNARHFNADVIISLIDAWVMDPTALQQFGAKWIPWFPVDSEPVQPPVVNSISKAYRRIVFSRFAERMVNDAGLDCYYVPHGVNTKLFKPGNREAARRLINMPLDRYLVGMVAANKGNPSRKALCENIAAFKILHDKHPDTLLYLHTVRGERGGHLVNLAEYVKSLGLVEGKDVIFSEPYMQSLGFADEYMVALYNALDVHLLVSMGEGFGIPIVEAQACGCPVIVGDWTAMSELCFSGWKVDKKDAAPFWTALASYQFLPRVDAIADKLEQAYRMLGNEDYRKRARDGALAYDAEKVAEKYWKPVLQDIEESVAAWRVTNHAHTWCKVGLFNQDGSMSVPCSDCGAELVIVNNKQEKVIEGGFTNPAGLKFTRPDGLEWLLLRETYRDYKAEELNLTQDSVVVDIGAHVGVVSMTLAQQFGCKVYAYEPEFNNYLRLEKNIEANGLSELIDINLLAVTKDGRLVKIATNSNNSGGGDIYSDHGVDVHSITLSGILDYVGGHIDLLKIDCEGAEFEILKDADLSKIKAIRGEFHGPEAPTLLELVKEQVPDTKVTLQGVKG